jgi:hypothetical protein
LFASTGLTVYAGSVDSQAGTRRLEGSVTAVDFAREFVRGGMPVRWRWVLPQEGAPVETIFERVAGLDVHKAQVTACVRVPKPSRGREQHLAEFSTTVRGLVAIARLA